MSTIESLFPDQLKQETTVTPVKKKSELGQDEFLKLMLAQMEHQDPFKPLENGEFVAQMAQFSTVAGIEGMESSLSAMSQSLAGNQLMQASSLIGRTALVPSSSASLADDSGIRGVFRIDEPSPSVAINIYSQSGELVHHTEQGPTPAGSHPFAWNGLLVDGTKAPIGDYKIAVNYGSGDSVTQAETLLENRISTISLTQGDNTVMFETEEGNLVSLLDIEQVK